MNESPKRSEKRGTYASDYRTMLCARSCSQSKISSRHLLSPAAVRSDLAELGASPNACDA